MELDYYNEDGLFWLRIGNWVLSIKDIRKHRLYFSERHGFTKHKMIGNYSICIKKYKNKKENIKMTQNYKVSDSIIMDGIEYTIMYFHKGTGSSALTAHLRAKGGGEKDVLKSELKADELISKKEFPSKKEVSSENVPLEKEEVKTSPIDAGYSTEPKASYTDAKPSETTFQKKNKKKKY